jgi:ketosteroid isomerase-like protein
LTLPEVKIVKSTRDVAQEYIDLLAGLRFAEAFEMLAPDAGYRIIGKTPLSNTFSKADLQKILVPALSKFKQPPTLTFHELIVDGNRAVALASGHGIGPTGLPYDQPHYAMVLRIEGGLITDVVEFMDTVEVETQIIGRKLVA